MLTLKMSVKGQDEMVPLALQLFLFTYVTELFYRPKLQHFDPK